VSESRRLGRTAKPDNWLVVGWRERAVVLRRRGRAGGGDEVVVEDLGAAVGEEWYAKTCLLGLGRLPSSVLTSPVLSLSGLCGDVQMRLCWLLSVLMVCSIYLPGYPLEHWHACYIRCYSAAYHLPTTCLPVFLLCACLLGGKCFNARLLLLLPSTPTHGRPRARHTYASQCDSRRYEPMPLAQLPASVDSVPIHSLKSAAAHACYVPAPLSTPNPLPSPLYTHPNIHSDPPASLRGCINARMAGSLRWRGGRRNEPCHVDDPSTVVKGEGENEISSPPINIIVTADSTSQRLPLHRTIISLQP